MADAEIGGKPVKADAKVVSGNRDEDAIERANEFIVDRRQPREHMSSGLGIHRCLENRLAELQLRILWAEILHREKIEVQDKPVYAYSNFLRGIRSIRSLLVRVHWSRFPSWAASCRETVPNMGC